MNYLSHYTEKAQTKLFEDMGAFFAFGFKQYREQAQPDIHYIRFDNGMVCPKENANKLLTELSKIKEKGIATDIEENGIKAIIHRELANHECQITYDPAAAIAALEDYNIPEETIRAEFKVFYRHCVKNDLF